MKYKQERVVAASYTNPNGNPFLEALPEMMSQEEFTEAIKSGIAFPGSYRTWNAADRRNWLTSLSQWFQPMDYMYTLYDMLYRAMSATYQTKTIAESVRQLNEIYMDFRTGNECRVSYATQAYSGAVLGVPGIGKTSTIQRCFHIIPQVVAHTVYENRQFYAKQINYLFVECPSDCSIKTLTFNILSAIDRAIGSSYFSQSANFRSMSSSALTTKLKIICLNHHIGLIVIDEIQNAIQTAAKNKQTRPLIKFLLELMNETATGIIFCGTLEAEDLFGRQEHLKRRTRGLRLLPMKYDAVYRKFISELWQYQVTLKKSVLTEKLMKQIYDLSGGIPAYIVKIIQESQVQAILSGKEKVSYEEIKRTVELLGIEVPKVYGRGGTSISDFSIQQVEPEELGEAEEGLDEESSVIPFPAVLEPFPVETEKVLAPKEEQPVSRFYASTRGRKKTERDKTDLIALWSETKNQNAFLEAVSQYEILERRSF